MNININRITALKQTISKAIRVLTYIFQEYLLLLKHKNQLASMEELQLMQCYIIDLIFCVSSKYSTK